MSEPIDILTATNEVIQQAVVTTLGSSEMGGSPVTPMKSLL